MVLSTSLVLTVLFAHFLCDFMLQSRWMAENKSRDVFPLTVHVMVYTTGLMAMLVPLYGTWLLPWIVLNGLLHLVVDFFTSKTSSFFYKKGNMHAFWTTIGFDQWLHAACLIGTLTTVRMS